MTSDIIDDRLIGALHVRALTHAGLNHDPVAEHTVVQAGTLEALLAGGYDGDTTLGEVLRLGTLGIGTSQALDGELIVVDGQAWTARADGSVAALDHSVMTPFAVVTPFAPTTRSVISTSLDFDQLHEALDELAPVDAPVIAVRIDGEFTDLVLRSVARQSKPYRPLRDVVADQSEWRVDRASGTVVGFRFPDATAGLEVPGHHLHFLSDDRSLGGHIISISLKQGSIAIDPCHDLHVELPPGMQLGQPGNVDRLEIAQIEGGTNG
ncbi:MAG: acetolactate decarboxylase [Acidimicrobiales bacterium]